jgi:DNA helicase HerA-like ATPase
MQRRNALLQEHDKREFTAHDGFGVVMVVIDELMVYLTGDRKQAAEFSDLLRRLVTLGRAAGIVPVLSTQKPSSDIVNTGIRDNVVYRAAFRTTTKEASDCILSAGSASAGYSATTIDPATPGVCWLLAEGSVPTKLRCFHLDDEALDTVVARAKALRA